jgi:hypothetical protein
MSYAMLSRWFELLTPARIRNYPLVATAVILLAALGYAACGPPDAKWVFLGPDSRAFYTAGTMLGSARSDLLYDVAAEQSLQERLFAGRAAQGVSVWMNPPFFAWVFVPLAHLPFFGALLVLWLWGLAFAWIALAQLARELGRPLVFSMALATALYYPTLQCFFDGQLTSLALLIFSLFFVLLRRGQDVAAGAVLGCLAYKPQLALGLVTALAGARRIRPLAAAATTAAGWVLVSLVTLPEASRDYLLHLRELSEVPRSDGYHVAGLHGLFEVGTLLLDAVSPRAGAVLGAALTAAALLALARLWWGRAWTPATPDWDRRMAATFALATIASPHLFGYDLMLLVVPLFIVWHLFPFGTAGRPLDGGPLLAATALGWAVPLVGPALTYAQREISRWAFGRAMALQIGVVVVALWAWLTVRSGAAEARVDTARKKVKLSC